MTPEKKVKKAVVKILDEAGAFSFSPMTGGYGKSGIPDIVACYRGRFLAIECKAGKNKPTALQIMRLDEIRESGGMSMVVNENNVDEVTEVLEYIRMSNWKRGLEK